MIFTRRGEGRRKAYVSTVLFDHETEVLHDRLPIDKVAAMTDSDYTVRGCTALLDAIGKSIRHIGNIHKYARPEDVPEQTMFVITTDGMENASREFSGREIKRLIEKQKKKYGWEFLFIGANIDSIAAAHSFGIAGDRAVNYRADAKGTGVVYDSVCAAVSEVRGGRPLSAKWSARIQEDYNSRK